MDKKFAILLIGHEESEKLKTLNLLSDKLKSLPCVYTAIKDSWSNLGELFSYGQKKVAIFNRSLWRKYPDYICYLPIVSDPTELLQYDVVIAPTFYKGSEKDTTIKQLENIGFKVYTVRRCYINYETMLGIIPARKFDAELNKINDVYHEADSNHLLNMIRLISEQTDTN